MPARIPIDQARLADFWRRHSIKSVALFGSVLRDDFRPDSDVDVLVELDPNAQISLLRFVGIQLEMSELLGRNVHLVERRSLRNPYRRRAILGTAERVYAA